MTTSLRCLVCIGWVVDLTLVAHGLGGRPISGEDKVNKSADNGAEEFLTLHNLNEQINVLV
jgi:hypothetical protein